MKLLLLILLLMCSPAHAESWVFQPSYHSRKAPAKPRPSARVESGYVNRGYRFSRSTINVGGYVFDNLYLYESWKQKR